MTSLILHVGPPKCGSTSIQQFFATQERPCVQNTHYILLDPLEISELNREQPSESVLSTFTQLLADNLTGCDVLILSHEYLFECQYAIKNICSLAKNLVNEISIIGYSRRQSEFLVSSYSQWGFRVPDRITEANIVLDKIKLDPVLFSGLEQQLIVSIVNDFYDYRYEEYRIFDWYNSYKGIMQLIDKSGAVIKCGVLPNKEFGNTLIQDFCEKSGLTLHNEINDTSQPVFNISFNQDLIEAINNAVAFGLDVPGPHENNDVLGLLSNNMVTLTNYSSEFLSNLKSYIDSYFFSLNQQFCHEYDLRETYFAASARFSKQEILDLIIHEGQQRAMNKSMVINHYRMLAARMVELCLKLTKENSYIRDNSPAPVDDIPAPVDTKLEDYSILRALKKLFQY
jgi:hypothetical protein